MDGEHRFRVEVSNPYYAYGDPQFHECVGIVDLRDRLQFLLGWADYAIEDIASELVEGDTDGFDHEDHETGRTVTVQRVRAEVPA